MRSGSVGSDCAHGDKRVGGGGSASEFQRYMIWGLGRSWVVGG